MLEAAFGQSERLCRSNIREGQLYKFDLGGNPFTTSYQFCGARQVDDRSVNDIYDGTARLQALTFGYKVAEVVDLRLEGTG